MTPRALRDQLEATQAENRRLERELGEAKAEAARLAKAVEQLNSRLEVARVEQERLAALWVKHALNPEGQKSAFGVADVPKLMAYLKRR